MCSKVCGGSEPLKKAIGWPLGSSDTKNFHIFLHTRHRATNTKLGLHFSNAMRITLPPPLRNAMPLAILGYNQKQKAPNQGFH